MQHDTGGKVQGGAGHQRPPPAPAEDMPVRGEQCQPKQHQALQADVRQAPDVAGAVRGDAEDNDHEPEADPKNARGRRGGPLPPPGLAPHGEPGDAAEGQQQVELITLEKPVADVTPGT